MTASVFDSALYSGLFPTGEARRLFSDSAAIRAMLLVEGALAKAQGELAIIPETSAAAIQRASREVQIDPAALKESTGLNGVCVPGLVTAFRQEMNAPEHAQYVHWGATSQDIIDSALMLRLKQVLNVLEQDLRRVLSTLARDALRYADTTMAARTYAQIATPTTWGAVLAQWGEPLVDAVHSLPDLRRSCLWLSLSGASGTSAALGPDIAQLRAAMASDLGLENPGRSWHTDRRPVLRLANWMDGVMATLSAMADTLVALSADGIGEVFFETAGASSTMPQKRNPVAASALSALARQSAALRGALSSSASHQHQRDGAAWFLEWILLPQYVLTTASALQVAMGLCQSMRLDERKMPGALTQNQGTIQAEALSFALAQQMPREEAQREAKRLCEQAQATQSELKKIARSAYPTLPEAVFDPSQNTGEAAAAAKHFADRVDAL